MNNLHQPVFNSHFSYELQVFLETKRASGYKYESESWILSRLDKYFYDNSIMELTVESILGWTEKRKTESVKTHSIRVTILRQFCVFLNDRDRKVPLPQQPKNLGHLKSFTPYIFTKEQIQKLIKSADTMPIRRNGKNIAVIMPILLRLLYCSGLRINEALGLKVENFNSNQQTITILNGKNDDSRIVPLTKQLKNTLDDYLKSLYTHPKSDDFIFPTSKKEPYNSRTIYGAFRELLWRCGISHGGRGKGPRLHDLRHTFAVHSLQKLVSEGHDTYLLLPILSTYLGHKSIHATERYLRLTSEVYPDILKKANLLTSGLIPEVNYYEVE